MAHEILKWKVLLDGSWIIEMEEHNICVSVGWALLENLFSLLVSA